MANARDPGPSTAPASTIWFTLPTRTGALARLAAVSEVVVVVLAATLLGRLLLRVWNVPPDDSFLFPAGGSAPDFLRAAWAEGLRHLTRYGLLALFVVVVARVRGRTSLTSYALSLEGGFLRLTRIGVVLGLVSLLPNRILFAVDTYVYDLGPGRPVWDLIGHATWDWTFLAWIAVSSVVVVPFVEELMARGYMLGRLRENFSAGAAVLLISAFFAAAHRQYFQATPLMIGQLASIVVGSVCWSYVVVRTGSLWPAIVAHGIANLPFRGAGIIGAIIVGLFALVAYRRGVWTYARGLGRALAEIDEWGTVATLVLLVAITALTIGVAPWAPYAWVGVYLSFFVVSLRITSQWRDVGRVPGEQATRS